MKVLARAMRQGKKDIQNGKTRSKTVTVAKLQDIIHRKS